MFGYQRIVIAENERGLQFRDRRLERVLDTGVYRFFDPLRRVAVERYDLSQPAFDHRLADYLVKERPQLCADYFQRIELDEQHAGLVYQNERLADILPPGTRQLYWQGALTVRVEAVPVADDLRIADDVATLLRAPRDDHDALQRAVARYVLLAEVADHQLGLLLVDGVLKDTLRPGRYAFWRFRHHIEVERTDTRLQTLEVSGQEILTKDKVSLRLNLVANYRIADPVKARAEVVHAKDFLYRELQFALRQAIGTRSLDELLSDKTRLDDSLSEQAGGRAAAHGLEVASVGIKDVILPGDMKDILNQVVEAEKVAQANVIKRREETAATRSLLNTAKLMEDNPTLLRLKELETLEKVTGKIEKLTVFGGLEGVLQELVTVKPRQG